MDERKSAASLFSYLYGNQLKEGNISLLVDGLEDGRNSFNDVYSSWPFRCWTITDKKIGYIGMPTIDGDNLTTAPLEEWLQSFTRITQTTVHE
jgi:hypothetical protein